MAVGFMTHVTCRLTAKDQDQLRNPTLGNRVWATFTFFTYLRVLAACSIAGAASRTDLVRSVVVACSRLQLSVELGRRASEPSRVRLSLRLLLRLFATETSPRLSRRRPGVVPPLARHAP